MNIYVALSLFSLVIIIYSVIAEVFTILFRLAGLPEERARFQVVSLLTNCGFTTKESEILLSSRKRRRLARITMLFGYVFNITIVSAIINIFFTMNSVQFGSAALALLIPIITILLIFLLMRIPGVRAWLNRIFEKIANRVLRNEEHYNPVLQLDYIGSDSIALVTLNTVPEMFSGKALSEVRLRSDYGILVMLVERPGSKPEAAGPDTQFQKNDKLTVFGGYAQICRVFHAKEHFSDEDR